MPSAGVGSAPGAGPAVARVGQEGPPFSPSQVAPNTGTDAALESGPVIGPQDSVPQQYGLATLRERVAVGAERDASDRVVGVEPVAVERPAEGPARGDIPEADRAIVLTCRKRLAVRAERQAANQGYGSFEGRAQRATRADVPEPHRRVVAARGECLAVGTERHAPDEVGVAAQRSAGPS